MLSVTELTSLLRANRLRLTKRLGQHHLVDARLVERMLERCQIGATDTVVEIGAGLGALTEPLALRARRVIAIERDARCCALLAARLAGYRHVHVICQDILTFSWERLSGVTVVGAIPYHITSPIFVALCAARRSIRRAVLIVQKEVGQRLLAQAGTKAYGRLSLLAQYCWVIARAMAVPRQAFFPPPGIDSWCLLLGARERPPVEVADERLLFGVVRAAFSQRRKTLVNCLSGSPPVPNGGSRSPFDGPSLERISKRHAQDLLRRLGLPDSVRGEALSLRDFAALADLLVAHRTHDSR